MLKQLTEHIKYLPACEQGDRPALAYIAGRNRALMVDAGNSPAHAQLFLSALERQGLPAPDYIALTHWNWDHCFGLAALAGTSLCSAETNAKLAEMARWQWDDASMAQRLRDGTEIAFCDQNIKLEYPDRAQIAVRTADIAFSGALCLNLGGLTAQLLPLPNSHAAGSLAVFVPEEKALILGDIICEDFYGSNPPAHDPVKLAGMIEALEALDFEVVLYGHGEPAAEPKADLMGYLRKMLAACGAQEKERD